MSFGKQLYERAIPLTIWIVMTIFGVSLFFSSILWAQFVPAKSSWTIGGVLWLTVVVLALFGFI